MLLEAIKASCLHVYYGIIREYFANCEVTQAKKSNSLKVMCFFILLLLLFLEVIKEMRKESLCVFNRRDISSCSNVYFFIICDVTVHHLHIEISFLTNTTNINSGIRFHYIATFFFSHSISLRDLS